MRLVTFLSTEFIKIKGNETNTQQENAVHTIIGVLRRFLREKDVSTQVCNDGERHQ